MLQAFRVIATRTGFPRVGIAPGALLLLILCFVLRSGVTLAEDIEPPVVIANPSVPLDTINLNELREIFSMRKRNWLDGRPVRVFVQQQDSELHRQFCKLRLNVFPRRLEALWYRKVFTGTGMAPERVESEQEMVQRVANTPGAIGYVSKAVDRSHVKVLKINE